MKRYAFLLDDLGRAQVVEVKERGLFRAEEVQALAVEVNERIAHKEECSLIADYHTQCDCGFVDLRARLTQIIEAP